MSGHAMHLPQCQLRLEVQYEANNAPSQEVHKRYMLVVEGDACRKVARTRWSFVPYQQP
jgi:hypothetical protein